jgi:AbrB family looped-hinge helix DNA binding protein
MTTTVNAKGQVTIPEPLRRKYGLHQGSEVVWIESNGQLILHPLMAVRDLYGWLATEPGQESLTSALLKERQNERNREDTV